MLLLAAAAIVIALDNRGLPRRSRIVERLGAAEKARLAEAIHLRQALGDSVWPGWGRQDVPVVLYNERCAFVVGCPDPPRGWIKVPGQQTRGGPWVCVPDDSFAGSPYYMQSLPRPTVNPEAFTVRLGDRWAASAPTLEWMRIDLARQIRSQLPSALATVFPYRWAVRLLIGGTDGYLCLVEHEAFHAFQGSLAPERLAAAERSTALEDEYEAASPGMAGAWGRELGLLARCARSGTRAQCRTLAQRFLAQRSERRAAAGLSAALIDYERQREWLEGLAKYVELESWRRAATSPGYRPLAAVETDASFRGYAGFDRRRSRELTQMLWSKGDVRFYYSGMAQAMALDRLMPGSVNWRSLTSCRRRISSARWMTLRGSPARRATSMQ